MDNLTPFIQGNKLEAAYPDGTRALQDINVSIRVGYVFQNPDHRLFTNNCRDEIACGPRDIQLSEDEVRLRVEEAAHVVGLPDVLYEEHPFSLSKGLRQRVAIASTPGLCSLLSTPDT